MLTKKKIFNLIVYLLLISLVTGFVLFNILFSPDRIKNAIEETASAVFQREVTIEQASLRPGLIELKQVKILPREHEEEAGVLFSCERLDIGFEILPLLKRRFVFRSISAYSPVIDLETIPPVDINKILTHTVTGRASSSIEFALSALEIFNGKLTLKRPAILLEEWDFKMKDISLRRSFFIETSAGILESNFESLSLESEIDLLRNLADVKNITLTGYGGRAEGSGAVRDLLYSPQVDISYRVEEFPSEILSDEIKFEGRPQIKGNLSRKDDRLYLEWDSDFSEVDMEVEDIIRKVPEKLLRFRGGVSYTPGPIYINWYVFETGPDTFSGTGLVDENGVVKLNIKGDDLNLKNIGEILLPVKKYVSRGQGELKANATLARGKSSIEGKFSMQDVEIKNVPGVSDLYQRLRRTRRREFLFDSVQSEIFVDGDRLLLKELSVDGPHLRGSGSGELVWGEGVDFTFYPIIRGSRIGIRVYGSPGDTRISLK